MSKIKIVPREGSRKIGTNIVKKYYDSLAHVAREESSSEEVFKDERWTGTLQKFVPVFYNSLRRYPFMDPTDVNLLRPLVDPVSQEAGFKKLNEIVKRLRLKNDKGELITSIDIFNQDDDFLTHDDVFIKLNGGLGDFDDTNPIHDIMLLHLRATEEFEVGPEKNHPIMNIKVKYVIVDPELEERLIKEQRLNRRKVTRALDSLDKMSKKIKVALMLNLIDKHTVNKESTLDNLIEAYAFDDKTYAFKTTTRQQHFLQVMEEDDNVLDAHYLFSLAMELGFIKYNNSHYMAFGEILGGTRTTAIENLALENYKHLFKQLADACKFGIQMQLVDKKNDEDQRGSLSEHSKIINETYASKILKEDDTEPVKDTEPSQKEKEKGKDK